MMKKLLFDAHLHIINPRFPLIPNHGYLPSPYLCQEYLEQMAAYNLCGGVVVSGSFQGFDQNYLRDALATLNKKRCESNLASFVGVTQLPVSIDDDEILSLDQHGVRGVRFNLFRGGSEELVYMENIAARVYELVGWHVELYVDSMQLTSIEKRLARLPKVSIDHLGISKYGVENLLRLVSKGISVKATGFSRGSVNVVDTIQKIHQENPKALMFGSDLPGTRAPRAFTEKDIQLIEEALGENAAKAVFYENALTFYRQYNRVCGEKVTGENT